MTICELLLQKMDSKDKINKYDLNHFLIFYHLYEEALLRSVSSPRSPDSDETFYFKVP